jgi:hypothetical protein
MCARNHSILAALRNPWVRIRMEAGAKVACDVVATVKKPAPDTAQVTRGRRE